jgi:hypothetical protein
MWWWWCQDRSKTPLLETRERPGRGHQCPSGPTTPVVLRYFLLNSGWPAELLDGGKRFVAVDGCYLDCSTTCIEHLRSWRWRYLPSPGWPVGVEDCDPQLESRVSNDQSISIDHASFTGFFGSVLNCARVQNPTYHFGLLLVYVHMRRNSGASGQQPTSGVVPSPETVFGNGRNRS